MKRVKTSELIDATLDWAVATALGLGYRNDEKYGPMCFRPSSTRGTVAWDSKPLPYSTDWSQGGPIIEREKITFSDHSTGWAAGYNGTLNAFGPTPLVAAMRCFVTSKLGNEVDVPEELT